MESVNCTLNSILLRRTESRKTNVAQTFVVVNKLSWFIAYENINLLVLLKVWLCMA